MPLTGAITPPADEALDLTEAERLIEGIGWKPGVCDPAVLSAVARALQGLENARFVVQDAGMAEYLASMRRIADAEIAGVPTGSFSSCPGDLPSQMVERVL